MNPGLRSTTYDVQDLFSFLEARNATLRLTNSRVATRFQDSIIGRGQRHAFSGFSGGTASISWVCSSHMAAQHSFQNLTERLEADHERSLGMRREESDWLENLEKKGFCHLSNVPSSVFCRFPCVYSRRFATATARTEGLGSNYIPC